MVRIQPIVDKKLIVLVTVPPEYDVYKSNPYLYIEYIPQKRRERIHLSSEGQGLAFSADFEMSNNIGYSVVTITISLSIEGFKSPQVVLEYLKNYLSNMKENRREYQVLKEISECIFE